MNKSLINITLHLIIATCCFGQQGYTGIDSPGENYRIYPGQVNQSEVFIVNSPVDEDVLFASCNTLTFSPFFVSEGIYVTTNGGESWQGSDTCTGDPIAFHGGDPGIAIDKDGTFIITRLGRTPLTGLYSHYSTDQGATWSQSQVISTDDLERASLRSDIFTNSSYYGRSYAAWVKFAQPFPIVFSFTDNVGQNWSTPVAINSPANRSAGGDLAIGPNGEVYACWAGVTETSPFKEILVGFARSTSGGAGWNVTENAVPMNGITGVLTDKGGIRVNGLPAIAVDTTSGPRHGWIYVVTGQKELAPAGNDPDIVLYRSENNGATWSSGIRVNQDNLSNGKIQYFPVVHIDRFGAVNVLFYDDRNTTIDSTGVFLARSTDGGNSWVEYEVSDHNFKPEAIGGLGQGYQGDNIDLTSTTTHLWPVWMDNSSGLYQIWTAPIEFTDIQAAGDLLESDGRYGLKSIYPNPASDRVNISFQANKAGEVSLAIFDMCGKLFFESSDFFRSQQQQQILINLSELNLQNGVYLVVLKLGETIHSERFVLSK